MKRQMRTGVVAALMALVGFATASAQPSGRTSNPRSGVCFYEDVNFEGQYFCSPSGRSTARVPAGANDHISSIRIFGDAEVTVYGDANFEGPGRTFTSSVPDLRRSGFNDRVSSFRTDQRGVGTSGSWDRWGDDRPQGGAWPRDNGAYRRDDGPIQSDRYSRQRAYQSAESMVRRVYRSVLNRDPDPTGLRDWTRNVLENNLSERDLVNQLRQSDEYRQLRENQWR